MIFSSKRFDSAIIIVDFNTMLRTIQYIEDSRRNILSDQTLYVIVENGSENDNLLKKHYIELDRNNTESNIESRISLYSIFQYDEGHIIIFLKANENYGFAISNNIGAEYAAKYIKDDGVFIFSNNDIFFNQQIDLNYFFEQFKSNPDIGLIGPRVIGLDGNSQTPYKYINFGKRYLRTFIFWPFDRILLGKKSVDDIIYDARSGSSPYRVIGAFMIFSKESFEKIGKFDEHTFMYYEESIISERLTRANLKVIYDDTYTILHEGGATTSNVFTTADRLKREFESALYYYSNYKNLGKLSEFLSKRLFKFYLWKRGLYKRTKKD